MFHKERWYEAHRSHAYQWAARKWGHLRVIIAISVINIFWLLPLAYVVYIYPQWGLVIMAVAFMPMVLLALVLGAGRAEINSA